MSIKEERIAVGLRFRAVREQVLNLSQDEMAAKLNRTRGAVSQVELGKSFPAREHLKYIYDATGISADFILFGDQRKLTVGQQHDLGLSERA